MENQFFLRSDLDLIEQIKVEDNSKALEYLFERYFSPLCIFAETLLKNSGQAEEVVSDVFVKVWSRRKCLQINSNVRAYLYKCVKNESLNQLKKGYWDFEDLAEKEPDTLYMSETAETAMIYQETCRSINNLINQMPPKRALIFRLNRIDGLKYSEIAELLSISIYTVQNHMVEAVRFVASHHSNIKSR